MFLGGNCRFYPSCSSYSKEAFNTLSFKTAAFLTIKRILKCHPFGTQGYDPVPHSSKGNHH
ncbi:MAG: membrane protein insertion efficiency factor YidD, partial [Bdellovibrionales bacterium]